MKREVLININEASRILSVSENALRQWTDEGKIKAFITPGGHRRYSTTELKKFRNSHHKTLGIKDLAIEMEETVELHREIARKHISSASWYDILSLASREQLADSGRQLLHLIIRYITEPSKRDETVQLTRDVGRDIGKILANAALPLTSSVEAFLLHREPVMSAVTHLFKKREAFSGRIVDAIPLVTYIMDEALLALIEEHQRFQVSKPGKALGDTIN